MSVTWHWEQPKFISKVRGNDVFSRRLVSLQLPIQIAAELGNPRHRRI